MVAEDFSLVDDGCMLMAQARNKLCCAPGQPGKWTMAKAGPCAGERERDKERENEIR